MKYVFLILLTLFIVGCGQEGSTGCCSGGCGGCCGGDDLSNDRNGDGSLSRELHPTNPLNQARLQDTLGQNRRNSACDQSDETMVEVTATRTATQFGYSYDYSFTINACNEGLSVVGYSVQLEPGAIRSLTSGTVSKNREATGSGSKTLSTAYRQLCITTSDTDTFPPNGKASCVSFS